VAAWSTAPTEARGVAVGGADGTPAGEALVMAARRLHARGLLAGAEGNLSCRLADGTLLVTAAGVDKGALSAADLVRVAPDGTLLRGGEGRRPSSEVGMHLALYARRPDVMAVVHAHPSAATGFAAAGVPLPDDVLPEVPLLLGPVALVPYGRPGTPALATAMAPFLAAHETFLLANHGATTVGRSLEQALLRMESLEQAARILLAARCLGGAHPLPDGEAAAFHRARVAYPAGPTHRPPSQEAPGVAPTFPSHA
jgi:L-fuculose-phosphate aldolase